MPERCEREEDQRKERTERRADDDNDESGSEHEEGVRVGQVDNARQVEGVETGNGECPQRNKKPRDEEKHRESKDGEESESKAGDHKG